MQVKDQLGYTVQVPKPPLRIVSLVPSQTALLYSLGLAEEVVGITRFCIRPRTWHKTKPTVGGTKTAEVPKILGLTPNLILGNREENTKKQIEELRRHVSVWVSDVITLNDALNMIEAVGILTRREKQAGKMISGIRTSFEACPLIRKNRRVLYLIWRKPWMAAGTGTFINSILSLIGFNNALDLPRYPQLSVENIVALDPDTVLLPSEPFPFRQRHVDEIRTILPDADIMLVKGEWFSWYGSHLLKSVDYFKTLSSRGGDLKS